MKKYNKSRIMNRAHALRREKGLTMSEALKAAWAEEKAGIDAAASRLFAVRALIAKLEAEQTTLENTIKAACEESADRCVCGYGWKASWKPVTSSRFDSKSFKTQYGDLYTQFSKPQTVKRFLFAAV